MIFGPTPLDEAEGAILAHTIRLKDGVLKKGSVLNADSIATLRANGHAEVIAARLGQGDVPEDEAASRIADALMAPLSARSRAASASSAAIRVPRASSIAITFGQPARTAKKAKMTKLIATQNFGSSQKCS